MAWTMKLTKKSIESDSQISAARCPVAMRHHPRSLHDVGEKTLPTDVLSMTGQRAKKNLHLMAGCVGVPRN